MEIVQPPAVEEVAGSKVSAPPSNTDQPVSSFASLPSELKVAGGSIELAYQAALIAGQGGDYADGSERTFSCQTCHMRPTFAEGCNLDPGPRGDMPVHDLTGANYDASLASIDPTKFSLSSVGLPVAADWDGDGIDNLGFFVADQFHLSLNNNVTAGDNLNNADR